LDRLFLAGLVEEIAPRIRRRRVRSAEADRGSGTVVLSFDRTSSLVWSLLAEAPGLYLGEPPASTRTGAGAGARATRPGLKKSVVGAVVSGIEIAALDRIVSLSLEHTRLSGRTSRSRLVLEVLATRVDLYLVDSEQDGIVEVYSSARSRLGPGELYRPPPPMPDAVPVADANDLEPRLVEARRAGTRSRRSALLAATGLTPLLVREMEWLVDEERRSERAAFELVKERLADKRPVLYVAPDLLQARGRVLVASPMTLGSESRLAAYPLPEPSTFSVAMKEAIALALRIRRIRTVRGSLGAIASKRLERARKLRRKLLDDEASLERPEALRRKGETLLAALGRARRAPDGRTVSLPDLFDPEEKEIVLAIDPRLPLTGNAERFFSRAKKATRGLAELAKRIAAVEEEISYLESFECHVADAVEAAELDALEAEAREEGLVPVEPASAKAQKDSTRPKSTPPLPPREFVSCRGHSILVGRSARSNEEATFRIAGPDDLWLHAAGAAGAHVVLRPAPGAVADEREIEEAAGLAAYFSKLRNDTAVDVLVTERRHVARIKGAPRGLVKVAKARTVRVAPRLMPERVP
jgi:predicted ribosome quality control (RQC) complex YloA/Tae2 family protein